MRRKSEIAEKIREKISDGWEQRQARREYKKKRMKLLHARWSLRTGVQQEQLRKPHVINSLQP